MFCTLSLDIVWGWAMSDQGDSRKSRKAAILSLYREQLALLVERAGLDEKQFQSELKETKQISARVSGGWTGNKNRLPQKSKELKLVEYFSSKLNIPSHEISKHLGQTSVKALAETLDGKQSSSEIRIDLQSPIRTISDSRAKYLCGTYEMFRFSFAGIVGVPMIVREIVTISRHTQDSRCLRLDMYCCPAELDMEIEKWKSDVTNIEAAKSFEHFTGILYKFGHCFYGHASYANAENKEKRLRNLHFPFLEKERNVHFGIVSGYSSRKWEPVAVKAIACKLDNAPKWAAEDVSEIQLLHPDNPTLGRLSGLLRNRISEEESVLASDKKDQRLEWVALARPRKRTH
jgi:hypothetical protein